MFKASNFQLRLVDGPNYAAGRLEVLYQGVWGTVCGDHFGSTEAVIACKELGFLNRRSYWVSAYYGIGKGPIWLDHVDCFGNESSLAQCPHNPLGINNCHHGKYISIFIKEAVYRYYQVDSL